MTKLHCITWKSRDGWRWHMTRSGKIVAESGEAYCRPSGCKKTLNAIIKAIKAGAVTFACLSLLLGATCRQPNLEVGGAYAPTNAVGQVVYNDLGLYLADASYQFAYEAVLAPLRFERDNRASIFAINPTIGLSVKRAMDKVREQVWAVDVRWATARKAYRASPTPAGLTALQTILAEIQRLIPVVQGQLDPVYQSLVKPATP